ncbi:hypothetical protein M0R45_009249 [Rubus argutus]|uniref:tRNA pseudouridine synthase n=1 Tax=Rubus argutus TaxID=59490 RepID=A0AAW1Y6Y5_RUBAR
MSNQATDTDLITSLHSLVDSLQHRVEELEALNAKLSSQLAVCRCHQQQDKTEDSCVSFDNSVEKSTKSSFGSKKLPGYDTRIMNHHGKRYVALKVMYFGPRFYGFAAEAQMDPTVEVFEIFKALEKTRLLVGDKKESRYSRCGRTDKGVSSVGQVIALYLRSNLKEACETFSCLSREYYYLFWGENLNLLAMESAGKKFVGEHDFRNFCKMDALNVHNYMRKITSFAISPCDVRFEGNQLWAFKIKGHESPDVIDSLLDTDRIPRKPQYVMAPEIPLFFNPVNLRVSSSLARQRPDKLCARKRSSSLDNGTMKKKSSHVPLMSRPTEPSYEERRAKLNTRACGLKSL